MYSSLNLFGILYKIAFILSLSIFFSSYSAAGIESFSEKDLEKKETNLYFADRDSPFLKSETRQLLVFPDKHSYGKAIIEALIRGPDSERLIRTLPKNLKSRAFYISDKTAYIDLDIYDDLYVSAAKELLIIYSLVNSISLNIENIEYVKIIADGAEVETLAGHIDIRRALRADLVLTR